MKNLVDLIGPGAAKDLFFTARRMRRLGSEGAWPGVAHLPAGALDAALGEYTSALAENAPLIVAAAKAITREILEAIARP